MEFQSIYNIFHLQKCIWKCRLRNVGDFTQREMTCGTSHELWARLALCSISLHWRHNERHGVSNHQPHDCLHNCEFRRRPRKISRSASLAFVRGIHRWPVNSPHKRPITRKMFPLGDVTMLLWLCIGRFYPHPTGLLHWFCGYQTILTNVVYINQVIYMRALEINLNSKSKLVSGCNCVLNLEKYEMCLYRPI